MVKEGHKVEGDFFKMKSLGHEYVLMGKSQ